MFADLKQSLEDLVSQGMYRELKTIQSAQDRLVTMAGRPYINFCSNNYLGLANHPKVISAAKKALDQYGLGSGASRLVCGNNQEHDLLEKELAQFKHTQAALIFNSGFAANTGIIPGLFNREDTVFADKLNHASIIDGILLSRAELKRYNHVDCGHLEELLKEHKGQGRKLIVTDSVFSMDGDMAPLQDFVRLSKKYEALLMIDEAHAVGVLGSRGAGLAEHLNLTDSIDILMGTLSKAVGAQGGYVAINELLKKYLINKSRSFIYTTALPPAIMAGARAALKIIHDDQNRRKQLLANATYVRRGLKGLGFDVTNDITPIIPIRIGDSDKAVKMSQKLFDHGILISAIRPPTVPANTARLRLTVMATHTPEDLEQLINVFKQL